MDDLLPHIVVLRGFGKLNSKRGGDSTFEYSDTYLSARRKLEKSVYSECLINSDLSVIAANLSRSSEFFLTGCASIDR